MNKLVTQISSLVVVIGLGTLWAFNVIDGLQFTTMSTAIVAAIIALNQKFEKEVIEKQLTTAIGKTNDYYITNNELRYELDKVKTEKKIINDKLNVLKTSIVPSSVKLASPKLIPGFGMDEITEQKKVKPKKVKKPKQE